MPLSNELMRLYGLAATAVALHLLVLAALTGSLRAARKAYVNAEDATLLNATQTETDHPDVLRAKRAHQNALENAVPFFAIGLLYAMTEPSKLGAEVYFATFVAARILHSVFYMLGRQPFRTICFSIGAAAVTGMGVHVIRVLI